MRRVKKTATNNGVEGMSFGIYSTEEIRSLSVIKVTTGAAFTNMGRPAAGGVYDARMGPTSERDAVCLTCSQSSMHCPGHLGCIDLPLPVVNPVFRKELHSILRLLCTQCYRLQILGPAKWQMMAQIRLLDKGLVCEALEVDQLLSDPPNTETTDAEILNDWAKKVVHKYLKKIDKKTAGERNNIPTKTTEALRRLFIDAILKPSSMSKTCKFCKKKMKKPFIYQHKFIVNISGVEIAEKFTDRKGKANLKGSSKRTHSTVVVRADTLRDHLRNVWLNEQEILEALYPVFKRPDLQFPTDLFFIEALPVTPPVMRPLSMLGDGKQADNPQTVNLKNVLKYVAIVQSICQAMNEGEESLVEDKKSLLQQLKGSKLSEKLSNAWDELQISVDQLLDKNLTKNSNSKCVVGLKQIVEKKNGLLRMHMMGKRVNYAARSVITPDPNLNIDEIGIPEDFAKVLTFPQPVTPFNVEELRKMIINGPKVHPGATMVECEDGTVSLLKDDKPGPRQAAAKSLLTPSVRSNRGISGAKIVHRHLQNGDVLLLNRQPTLHRPSIMAHKARILKGERTIRLHYANCSSYNADFDGDEMNAHFPQNEVARSEAYNIVNVCHQYLVPKNGTPLSGLIQDHVISGVRLTLRGRFFSRQDYHQLVYQALASQSGAIQLLPPCIIKPRKLWSGKQIISTVILNVLPKNKPALNLEADAKITVKAWQTSPMRICSSGGSPLTGIDMTESEVIIQQGELLNGVLDKKHYGATPYGLIHCVYELYGGVYSAKLLSAFSKLFTAFLQTEGFTLGVADILVLKKADKKRTNFIKQSREIGDEIVKQALELPSETPKEELFKSMKTAFSTDSNKLVTRLDRSYKSALDSYTNDINKACLPVGLIRKFPENNLQLMVQSGAKGSTVNTMQISCLLGQIELEGKRPALMISGKSLPSFPPFDTSPRAGGFIDGRFMTGIRPQEFFFHCMAGREGLIDTAVKTSRSGYLQRCLVKHLEGVSVNYDQTVRDSDGSVIQYYYGEDGMDVCKAQFLKSGQLHVLAENSKIVLHKNKYKNEPEIQEELDAAKKEIHKWNKKSRATIKYKSGFLAFCEDVAENVEGISNEINKLTGRSKRTETIIEAWNALDAKAKRKYEKVHKSRPDPVSAKFRLDSHLGSLTEKMESLIEEKINNHDEKNAEKLKKIVYQKSMSSQCAPGEPVGMLAAQSVGEPSTQMTLNTFHFAGRGDMNVTLGIPRLRELLMLASKQMKTPSMDIPFLPHVKESKAEKFRLTLNKVTVVDVLEKIYVSEKIDIGVKKRQYTYKMRFCFLPRHVYKSKYAVKPSDILKYMEKHFFSILENNMRKYMQLKYESIEEKAEEQAKKRKQGIVDEDEEGVEDPKPEIMLDGEGHISSDEEVEPADDEDATAERRRARQTENREYDESDEEGGEKDSDVENENCDADSDSSNVEIPESIDQLLDDPHYQDFQNRVQTVKNHSCYVQSYEYDVNNELWCEVIMGVEFQEKKIDLATLLRDTVNRAVIWQIPNINKAFIYRSQDQELMLKVDGINIMELFKYSKLLDLNRIYSNDIYALASVYGIEFARRVLVREVQNVFEVYGITVDPRHLLLISDYMTFDGTYKAMNRTGMAASASSLQQMTFETTLAFLKQSVLNNSVDHIKSPSGCLIAGQPCKLGTGAFDLRRSMQ